MFRNGVRFLGNGKRSIVKLEKMTNLIDKLKIYRLYKIANLYILIFDIHFDCNQMHIAKLTTIHTNVMHIFEKHEVINLIVNKI